MSKVILPGEVICRELVDIEEDISMSVIYGLLRKHFPELRFYTEDASIATLIDGNVIIELSPSDGCKLVKVKLTENDKFTINTTVYIEILPKGGLILHDMMVAIITRAGRPAEHVGCEEETMKRHINRVFGGMKVTVHELRLNENSLLDSWEFLLSFKGQYIKIALPRNYYEKKS